MARIVVCDDVDGAFRNSGELRRLEAVGDVTVYDRVAETRQDLLERLRGASVVLEIRGRTVFDRETLVNLSDVCLIASTGPHRIDLRAAAELGIVVTTTPGTSTESVADHVFALILVLARHIIPADQALRRRRWEPVTGLELEGKILGILGLGRIGSAVAKRALGFGLHVIAWGPTLTPERAAASAAKMVSEEELFRTADILSVHLRYSELSDDFINADRLSLMKPSALLIDVSWKGIVNRQALTAMLQAGRLAGAALDLCHSCPIDMDDRILDAPRTVLTPHIAWQTVESYQRAARASVDSILAYVSGKPINVVNPDAFKSPRQAAQRR
ncbi:MAG: D-2-hydroxyacid dehydrogenase family protein [Deltaproteobacteria bacterium]|nr:D-2-hydroxyacid dehydrogenase family protein [Deltaproteobacteria bacterium]